MRLNAKTCKRLRRVARAVTPGLPLHRFIEKRNPYGYLLTAIRVDPDTTRGAYRRIKKLTRRGVIPLPAKTQA